MVSSSKPSFEEGKRPGIELLRIMNANERYLSIALELQLGVNSKMTYIFVVNHMWSIIDIEDTPKAICIDTLAVFMYKHSLYTQN